MPLEVVRVRSDIEERYSLSLSLSLFLYTHTHTHTTL